MLHVLTTPKSLWPQRAIATGALAPCLPCACLPLIPLLPTTCRSLSSPQVKPNSFWPEVFFTFHSLLPFPGLLLLNIWIFLIFQSQRSPPHSSSSHSVTSNSLPPLVHLPHSSLCPFIRLSSVSCHYKHQGGRVNVSFNTVYLVPGRRLTHSRHSKQVC